MEVLQISEISERHWRTCILKEMKSRRNSGNVCFCLPVCCQKYQDENEQNCDLSVVLYAGGTWSFALKDERELRMIENRVLREILGSKEKEVLRDWKRLDNEEIRDLYLPNVIWVRKWRMRWAWLVARIWEQRSALRILVYNLMERDHLGDLGVSGRMIWKWVLKWNRRTWT